MRPDLLTIQLGEQNTTIVNLITSCFDKVKDHDFSGATACAAQILGNASVGQPQQQLHDHPAATRIMARATAARDRAPRLPEPVSAACPTWSTVRCSACRSSTRTDLHRPVGTAPAGADDLDQVFQKLNKTIKDALAPFQAGPNGGAGSTSTLPEVQGPLHEDGGHHQDQGQHPGQIGRRPRPRVAEADFGCDDTWYVEGSDGTKLPNYLSRPRSASSIEGSRTPPGWASVSRRRS